MYEAASIDGATPSQQLKNITIPMMASSITINVITTTIAAFKAYELPYLISKGLPGHSTLLITQRIFFFGFQAFDYGRGSALSVVLLLSRIHVPAVIADTISTLAGATIPLSMLIIGTSLGAISVRAALTDWRVYAVSAVRLLVCPLLTWLVLRPFVSGVLLGIPVLLAACPSAMVVTALCLQYERSDAFASKCIFLSTVLSAVTIPLLIWLLF